MTWIKKIDEPPTGYGFGENKNWWKLFKDYEKIKREHDESKTERIQKITRPKLKVVGF